MSTKQPFGWLADAQELSWLLLLAGIFSLLIVVCALEELYLQSKKRKAAKPSRRPIAAKVIKPKPKLKRNRR